MLRLYSLGLLNCRWRSKTVFSWITPSKMNISVFWPISVFGWPHQRELWSCSEGADSRLSRCTAMAFTPDIQMKYARWVFPQLFISKDYLFGVKSPHLIKWSVSRLKDGEEEEKIGSSDINPVSSVRVIICTANLTFCKTFLNASWRLFSFVSTWSCECARTRVF